jgi:hypothetical protein
MLNQKNINEMNSQEAAKYYSSIGIVTHPLNGKKPYLHNWQRLTETSFESFKPNNNTGFICGQISDLTCVDIDWYVKSIWEYSLKDINVSDWVKQAHTDGNKYQIFGDIENRPVIPEEVCKKLNYVVDLYSDLVKQVLPKCRHTFHKLWKSVFEEK